MLSIQQVGKEILGDNPSNFYVFLGSEYGIKKKYVDHLSLYYDEVIELEYVDDVFNLFKQKHLFAPKPTLYIVRYDNNFIKSINNKTEEYIKSLKIAGTIVCIYEGDSVASKCNKYIPDMSVSFDNISDELCFKYLKNDFKALNETVLKYIAKNSHGYYQANIMCNSIANISKETTLQDIKYTFDINNETTDEEFRHSFMKKDYVKLIDMLERYEDLTNIYYLMLNSLLDIEKQLTSRYKKANDSNIWNLQDVYNMFMNVYHEIKKTRKISSYSIKYSLEYLFSLLNYQQIPSVGDLEWNL